MNVELIARWLDRIVFISLLGFWCALGFSNALVEITFMAALLSWAAGRFLRKDYRLYIPGAIFFPLALYIALVSSSAVWSEYPAQSVRGAVKVLQHFFLFWISAEAFRVKERRDMFEKVFLAFFVVLLIDGYFQLISGVDLIRHFKAAHSSAGYRVSASFKSYGLLAAYLICTVPLLAVILLEASQKKGTALNRLICGAVLAGAVGLLVLTRSRGGVIAFFAGVILYLVLRRKWKAIAFGIIAAAFLALAVPRTMLIHKNLEGGEQSLIERYYLWDRAMNVIKAKPVQGTGINTYVTAHEKYDTTQNWRVRDYYAHNGYLQIAAETGVPSLLLLLFYIFIFFRGLWKSGNRLLANRNRAKTVGIAFGLVNFLFFALIDTVFHNPQAVMVFWFLSGLALAYAGVVRDASVAGDSWCWK
ncbi:MAG: hypothetical protein A2Z83_05980 [Omnitrophica bacterium GWA2_52_8]|nr:MAG: hypothetical protein A2Z83_05980 [Omnitrophica bacterium GWA2_52_8]